MFPQEFEKDDDSNGHIDFITSASVSYHNYLLFYDAFHSIKKFRYELLEIYSDECEVHRNFRKFLTENSIRFDFPPGICEIFGIFGWMVCLSEIQQFPDWIFWKLSREISVPYVPVSKF